MEPNDQVEVVTTENDDTVETPEVIKEEAKEEKPKRTPEEEIKYLEGRAKRLRTAHGLALPEPKVAQPTGEVEDTTQLLLEVKGITTDDDVKLFQKWKNDTNRKPREILNNSIFQAELAALRADKATQAAIPSSNGRGAGGSSVNVQAAVEKFQRTGELPKDSETKEKVLTQVTSRDPLRTPPWRQ